MGLQLGLLGLIALAAWSLKIWPRPRSPTTGAPPCTLAAPPQRIISLYGGLTEILSALGVADRVVARIQGDETIKGIPTVGTHLQPNVEMILALKPDLVVQGGVAKGMPALKRLEAAQVPVAMFAPP